MITHRQLLTALLALVVTSAEAWDGVFVPAPDYTVAADMASTSPASAVMQDGRVAIANGYAIHVFDPAHSTVTRAATIPFSLPDASFVALLDGKALLIGGFYRMDRGIVFDPMNNSVVATQSLSTPRVWPSVTRLADGKIMIAGGRTTNTCATQLAKTEIYDPATGAFSSGPSMLQRRFHHSATLLANGRVLIYGGLGNAAGAPDSSSVYALDSAEIYDPSTNSFTYTHTPDGQQTYMWWSRSEHTATLLKNGSVMLCGGRQIGTTDYGVSYSCDVYKPATGQICSYPPVPGGCEGIGLPYGSGAMDHTATALTDGTMLIAGGIDNMWPIPKATARVIDPATGTSHEVSSMAYARRGAAAVRLLDGSVLMIGGQTTPTPPDPSLPYASYPWTPTMERYVPDDIFKDAFEH